VLTLRQRRLATRLARRMSDAHWPGSDGRCRVCGTVGCAVLPPALAWLTVVGDPHPPPGWPWDGQPPP
jgi:hypothetical protein